MSNCPPAPPSKTIDDPCSVLGELRFALYQLMTGNTVGLVAFKERHVRYQAANVAELKAEVRRLEALCPRGPNNPHGGPQSNHALAAGPRINPIAGYGRPNRFR